ncbi:MAG: transketolase [Deltaproteobacteria bacterium]|nr:transketolase [Deltaproteobacteria bacterium]
MTKISVQELQDIAQESRENILKMVHKAGCGHFGGPFSMIDMMTALYFYKLNLDPKNPSHEDRDRVILSAGHCCAALYATLAKLGTFPEEELWNFRQMGSPLQGHPKMKLEWGIEMSTGSLGQGMSIANGMALAARVSGKKYRVYSFETDGGTQEGMTWEGIMTAAHYRLDNRCVLFDLNNVQIDGYMSDVMNIQPITEKFQAFNWHVIYIDGHDMREICDALDEAERVKERPTAIIGKTVLGKGVSLFENKPKYHGVAPSDEELEIGLKELRGGHE